MNALLAATTNEIGASALPGKISTVLNGEAVVWAVAFTLLWDWVDLWIRYRRFDFATSSAFLIYLLFHAGISILATIALAKTFDTPWMIGLFAAVSNETILSNANITFGKASILPLLDKFRELRVAMQDEIDKIKEHAKAGLMGRLAAKLGVAGLEDKVKTLLVKDGKSLAEISKLLSDLKADCKGDEKLLAIKLAHDYIELDPVGAKDDAR